MTTTASASSPAPVSTPALYSGPRFLPLLLVLFIGSGAAALIYEIVWFQLLQLVIGSSAYSIAVLLGTFMGGMCLGSLAFNRIIPRRWHPLFVYACLELAIGAMALAVTLGMPLFDHLYVALGSPGQTAVMIRALVCAGRLLPPTILMGATLPAISRWIETTPQGVAWLGFFYGGNTAGAVIGCLVAGFYLLPNFDMASVTYIAAGLNLIVGVIGVILSKVTPHGRAAGRLAGPTAVLEDGNETDGAMAGSDAGSPISIYAAIALSGMAALGAEVVWTRLLSLLLGATTYTFSIILAVFLLGLGVGSSIGAMMARSAVHPRMALVWSQLLCAAGIAWTAYALTSGLPNWPVDPTLSLNPAFGFQLDLARCMWAIFLPTLFWARSFPLALAAAVGTSPPPPAADRGGNGAAGYAAASAAADPARVVGRVYAANTVGAIIGALAFSLWLIPIPNFGTRQCEHVLIALAGLSAIVALMPLFAPTTVLGMRRPSTTSVIVSFFAALIIPAGAIAMLQVEDLDKLPWKLVAYGRRINDSVNQAYAEPLFVGEGINSTVAVTERGDGSRRFHVSGKVEASTLPEDMRLQLMLGHFPALFHPHPKKVLIVGCGAGVTAGCFMLHPDVEKIVICEIEPLIPQVVAQHFALENNGVVLRDKDGKLSDSRVEIVYDDARHYILTTHEKFDIITSDPIHPWVKGAATLYTKEYFDLVKQHLNPGGLVTQWVPLYESSESAVKSEIATFFAAFPSGTIWNNSSGGNGYDIVVMGGDSPLHIDTATLRTRLIRPVAAALEKSGFASELDILETYGGQATELTSWLERAQINYDRNLRLQYLAGVSVNSDEANGIINGILARRTYPTQLFTASPDEKTAIIRSWMPTIPSAPPGH